MTIDSSNLKESIEELYGTRVVGSNMHEASKSDQE